MSFSLTLKFNAAEAIAIDCLLRNFERQLGSKKVLVPGLAVAWLWAVAVAVRLCDYSITSLLGKLVSYHLYCA